MRRDTALSIHVERVDRDRLVRDVALTRSIYSILSAAHYRSSPNDLQMMLEAPGHVVYVAVVEGLVGGALEAVVEPRRGYRGRGIIPDVLERVAGCDPGPGYRIVRIAVAPCIQRRGVGRRLVERLALDAAREGLGWVGASFGHHEALGFWLRLGFTPVHVSPRFNPATGEKNIVVVKPLAEEASRCVYRAACSLAARLVLSGASVYRDVAAETVAKLLSAIPPGCTLPEPTQEQLERLEAFLGGKLAYETVHDTLLTLTLAALTTGSLQELDEKTLNLWTLLVVQGKPVNEAEKLLGLGPREAEEKLREAAARLYTRYKRRGNPSPGTPGSPSQSSGGNTPAHR